MSAQPQPTQPRTFRFSGRWARRMAALAGALFIGATGTAMKTPPLVAGEIGIVSSVVDGDTLFLASGLKVRLSAIQAPKLPLGRAGFKAWPLGEEAKDALTQLTRNKRLQLYYGGEQRDRYGRALAQVFTLSPTGERDLWLQEEMIKRGLARVYTWPDTYQSSDILYAAEREARANGRGIWALDYYKIRDPDPNPLAQDVDSFQIIEGIVTSVADVRGRVYLNFGADYKTDFTVAIAKRNRKRFAKEGLDPLSLEGARVRVRGWVELTNGPMIWLDTASRLEVVDGQDS